MENKTAAQILDEWIPIQNSELERCVLTAMEEYKNQEVKALTEQVENLKEKVLTLDKVLKENHDQAQQQWEQDQAKISRLREGIQKFVFHWRKYFDSPKVGQPPDLNDLESLLSKFPEVPNE